MKSFFSKKRNTWLTVTAIALVVILIVGVAIGMANRHMYLQKAVVKVQEKLKNDYAVNFSVDKYEFSGLTTVDFHDVLILPENRDTLAQIHKLAVSIRILPLILGDVELGNIEVDDAAVTFIKKDSISNYDFLFSKKEKSSARKSESGGFADLAQRLTKQFFSIVPDDLRLNNLSVSYRDDKLSQKITIPSAIMNSGDFKSSLFLNDNQAEWILNGEMDASNQHMRIEVSSKETNTELPFLKGKYGLAVSFDKLIFDLQKVKKLKKNLLELSGSFSYENLKINHSRLSDSTIRLPHAQMEGGIQVADDYISLSDNSFIQVDDFKVSPKLKITLKPSKQIDLSIHTGMFQAQDFFDALPQGLFQHVDGLQVEGAIAYDLDFSIDVDKPDDLKFVSKIDDEDLKVIKWGRANIDSLNSSFVYDAYNDTVLVKQFIVGPENPNFRKLDKLPYVLKNTVRNTEDPFFYTHNGFEQEAFKLSIATNIKERKFKRGASTISMQLIKNVFLNRKKTLNRKFEEILLVWLMESSGSVSKDRLLEIYLNVIEWGNNIYGITEAANYYFKKRPEEINLGESLFLSSIIPRPKTGLRAFDYTGHLKAWNQRHFNTYGSIMRNLHELDNVPIPENFGFYQVLLQPALRPKAPVIQDSLSILAEQELMIRELEFEQNARQSIIDKLMEEKISNE